MPEIPVPDAVRVELSTFLRELPRLLQEGHEGRHVLVKGQQVLGPWDTFDEAYQAGVDRFGHGVPFLAQTVDPRFLKVSAPGRPAGASRLG